MWKSNTSLNERDLLREEDLLQSNIFTIPTAQGILDIAEFVSDLTWEIKERALEFLIQMTPPEDIGYMLEKAFSDSGFEQFKIKLSDTLDEGENLTGLVEKIEKLKRNGENGQQIFIYKTPIGYEYRRNNQEPILFTREEIEFIREFARTPFRKNV